MISADPPAEAGSSVPLVISTALGALSSIAFWLVAANQYSPTEVGLGAAAIATMLVLADVAHLGLRTGLLGPLGMLGGGDLARRLIAAAAGLSSVIAAALALVFMAGLELWSPDLLGLRDSVGMVALFVLASGFWVALLLSHSVLAAYGLTVWAPVAKAVLAGLQIGLLVVLADSSWELGVFMAWSLPVFAVVAGLGAVIARQLGRLPAGPGAQVPDALAELGFSDVSAPSAEEVRFGGVLGSSLIGWVADLARSGVIGVLPLLVLALTSAEGTAHWFVAWTVGYGAHLLCAGLSDAVLARRPVPAGDDSDAAAEASAPRTRLRTGLLGMAIAAPVAGIGLLAAPWVLQAFGTEYANESTTVLRLLFLAAIPNVVARSFLARLRSEGRMRVVIAYDAALALAVLVAGWVLLSAMGVPGLGLAWLLVLSAAAGFVLTVETLWWWAPRLGGRSVRWLRFVVRTSRRVANLRRAPALRREVREVLGQMYTSKPDWRRIELSADRQTLAVAGHEGRPPLRVELARTSWGAELLVKRLEAISDLGRLAGVASVRALVPYPIEHHAGSERQYLVESAISGRTGPAAAGQLPVDQLVVGVREAITQLHEATAETFTFDQPNLGRWVTQPLRRLAEAAKVTSSDIDALERVLRTGLQGRVVPSARLHGNLVLEHTLFDPYGRLTGVLDWEWSETGPAFIDWGSLALSALAVESRTDIGHVVGDALVNPETFARHPAIPPAAVSGLDPKMVVLAAWLHLLTPAVLAAATTPTSRFWMARNVQPALDRLPRLFAARG